jgi:hypothetical protein
MKQAPALSITACDTIKFTNIVAKVCKYVQLSKQGYLQTFFETGCQLIEEKFADNKPMQVKLLQKEEYGFWAWFLIEYMKHDEAMQNSTIPYRKYNQYKKMWLDTYRLDVALDNFYKNINCK